MNTPVRLTRSSTALLVVDVQERLLPVIDGAAELERRVVAFLQGAAALGLATIVTEQYPKGLGPTVASVAAALGATQTAAQGGAAPVEKLSFSCCGEPEVVRRLGAIAPRTVLVVGIEAHVCVLQTCLDLLERRLTPVVVADCVGSRHAYDRDVALARIAQAGGVVTTLESALFELLGVAGTDEFKAISKIVKPL